MSLIQLKLNIYFNQYLHTFMTNVWDLINLVHGSRPWMWTIKLVHSRSVRKPVLIVMHFYASISCVKAIVFSLGPMSCCLDVCPIV